MVLDVQREMLHAVQRRAKVAAITNVCSTQADASRLPFADHVFDGAYLIGVLGEIADGDTALQELRRVLKAGGRLVIGEIFVDPDLSSLGSVRERAEQAMFALRASLGIAPAYLARFEATEARPQAADGSTPRA